MTLATELTSAIEKKYSMEDQWLWYLAGTFDTSGVLTVKINKDDRYDIGYNLEPMLSISRPESKAGVLGMIDEYCEENQILYRTDELNGGETIRIVIKDRDSIERFLKPIIGGFVQQRKQAEVMLDEVIPSVESGEHTNKKGFYDLLDHVETLRKTISTRQSLKYTKEFFEDEWNLE